MNELKMIECPGAESSTEQTYIYWDRVREFMSQTGMSFATLARKSSIPDSTLRKLLQGVTRDPRISTIQPIFRALKLDANVALGLSPPRDYGAEIARENIPLTDALRQQLSEVRAERDAQLTELDRLRKLVLAKGEALSRLEGRTADVDHLAAQCADQQQRLEYKAEKIQAQAEEIAALKARIEARDKTVSNLEGMLRRQRSELHWMKIGTVLLVAIIVITTVYFIWEITNLDQGITAWLYPDLQK